MKQSEESMKHAIIEGSRKSIIVNDIDIDLDDLDMKRLTQD